MEKINNVIQENAVCSCTWKQRQEKCVYKQKSSIYLFVANAEVKERVLIDINNLLTFY